MIISRRLVAAAMVALAACTGPVTQNEPASSSRARARDTKPSPAAPQALTKPIGDWFESACSLPRELVARVRRGFHPQRSPDVLFVPREPNFFGGFRVTSHSGPWDYVQEVPLVFYGPGFIKSQGEISVEHEATVADLAPTFAELLESPFPKDRPGRALKEVLLPRSERAGKPKLIFTVVWDGGGWNVLNEWPDAWPELAKVMEKGSSVADATVGSSPSVTPAVHTTIGTGAFPKQHGIVDIPVRDGARVVGSYSGRTPKYLEVDTLADLFDRSSGNQSKIGVLAYKMWHVGMIGHGAYIEGGDRDIAVIAERTAGELETNESWYSIPPYLRSVGGFEQDVASVDAADGRRDGKWMGNDVLDDPNALRHTPAWVLYQTRLLKAMIGREGFGADGVPDLLYTNYKQVDEVGHEWNMIEPEMESILQYSDDALAELVRFLDEEVGKKRWVIVYTADHGQGPAARSTGAWPIQMGTLKEAVAAHFDVPTEDLFLDERPVGFWLNRTTMKAHEISAEDIAQYLTTYRVGDNVGPEDEVPEGYEDRTRELIFSAAWPASAMGRVWGCARTNK